MSVCSAGCQIVCWSLGLCRIPLLWLLSTRLPALMSLVPESGSGFWTLAVCISRPRCLDLGDLACLGSGRLGDHSEPHTKCSAGLIEGRHREATGAAKMPPRVVRVS